MPDSPDPRLQKLLDEREIRRLFERYCRGIDRLDEDLVRSVYHPDSTDDHGGYKGRGSEFAAYAIPVLREAYEATLHSIGQSHIDVEGDRASAETYVIAYHRRREGNDLFLDTFGGRYIDRLERRAGEWKISDRVVVHEWSTTERAESPFELDAFTQGARSRQDPSYRTAP